MASICGAPVCAGGKPQLKFTYTGDYVVRKDGVVELLTSGTIVFLEPRVIDVFMVGGGGAGGSCDSGSLKAAGGGAGGYTATAKKLNVSGEYDITIGAGATYPDRNLTGGGKTSFGTLVTANGGASAERLGGSSSDIGNGAAGGSGGGAGVQDSPAGGKGGENGGNGEDGTSRAGGAGQAFSTREFGEAFGKLYAGGGGGGRVYGGSGVVKQSAGGAGGGGYGSFIDAHNNVQATHGEANTGGGGGGGSARYNPTASGASGGSGIVCFREAQELPELAGTWVLNERLYAPEKDFDEITGYRFKVGTIECTRIRTSNLTYLSAYRVFSGDTVDIYTFNTNTWKTTARNLTFPADATASDEFRAWLASNATKQA